MKPKKYYVPDYVHKDSVKILQSLREKYGDEQIEQLEILADQYRFYRGAAKLVDFVDTAETKKNAEIANKALTQIRIIEKNLKPIGTNVKDKPNF